MIAHERKTTMSKVEQVANVAVILTCAFTIIHLAGVGGTRRMPPQTYKPGEKIVDTTRLGLRNAPRTLIMFESSTCRFCNESLGFYSRLSQQARANGVRIVALTPEDVGVNKTFLSAHGVSTDTVAGLKDNRLKVSATPTLILVRSDGTVVNSWVGKIATEKEAEVMATILG
jgi:thioredoxin-related protein